MHHLKGPNLSLAAKATHISPETLADLPDGLSHGPSLERDFAISYRLLHHKNGVMIQPQVYIWFQDAPQSQTSCQLLSSRPEKATRFVLPTLRFLEDIELAELAIKHLLDVTPKGQDDEYDFAITPHGAILLTEGWHYMRRHRPKEALGCVFLDEHLTSHGKIAAIAGLTDAVTKMLSFQTESRHQGVPIVSLDFS